MTTAIFSDLRRRYEAAMGDTGTADQQLEGLRSFCAFAAEQVPMEAGSQYIADEMRHSALRRAELIRAGLAMLELETADLDALAGGRELTPALRKLDADGIGWRTLVKAGVEGIGIEPVFLVLVDGSIGRLGAYKEASFFEPETDEHGDLIYRQISLAPGEAKEYSEGGDCEEGYQHVWRRFSHVGDAIVCEWATSARDCDGVHRSDGFMFCMIENLAARKPDLDADRHVALPGWEHE